MRTPKLPEVPVEETAPRVEKSAGLASPPADPPAKAPPEDEFTALAKRFEALKKR